MSRAGLPYDNAMAESFFASLKLELLEGANYTTREAAKQAVFEYMEIFYNRMRMHSSLQYRSPLQAEQEYQRTKSVS